MRNVTFLKLGRLEIISSQYPGVRAGLAPAQAGNREGLPLLLRRYLKSLFVIGDNHDG
jgi:hypothetical protein